jgi:hypothetical protein
MIISHPVSTPLGSQPSLLLTQGLAMRFVLVSGKISKYSISRDLKIGYILEFALLLLLGSLVTTL